MMSTQATANRLIYRFNGFRLDPAEFRLLHGATEIALEPKALQLLVFLVENRGRLLEKQQILDAVWGELAVTENALTREIAILRRALGDDTRRPRFVETIPTRGYRFIAEVEELGADASAPAAAPKSKSHKPGLWLTISLLAVMVVVLGALLARYLLPRNFQTRGTSASSHGRLVQVTFSPGLDIFPSFSPDGNSIAYSSDRSGSLEVYVRQLSATGGEIQVTHDRGSNVEAAFSPDGQYIAYHSRSRGGIWVIPALGGTARKLTEFGASPSWSPDGSRLVFESVDIGAFLETEVGSAPDSSIWLVNVADGKLEQVTRPAEMARREAGWAKEVAMFGKSTPQWLKDNHTILFSADGGLWTIGDDGQRLRPLTSGMFGYDAVYAGKSNTVLFLGGPAAAEFGIWQLKVDAHGSRLSAPQKLYSFVPGEAHYLAVSSDGRKAAFASLQTRDNLYAMALGKSDAAARAVPTALTQDTRLRKTNPSFSPDGKAVAFTVMQIGRMNQVWTAAIDGSHARQIPLSQSASSPGWLSNSEPVYWIYGNGDVKLAAWDLNQGAQRVIADLSEVEIGFARLSPGGDAVAYQRSAPGVMQVWKLSFKDKRPKQLTFDRNMAGWPSWSHDGKWIAVELRQPGGTNIGIVGAEGGAVEQVTHDPGQAWPSSWAPDNDRIAFAGFRDGRWNVFSVSRTTGREEQLTHYLRENTFVRYPEWSPTGKQIVYEYGESTANIWMLEPPR